METGDNKNESCSASALVSLNTAFESAKWRTEVVETLLNLEKRIVVMEKRYSSSVSNSKPPEGKLQLHRIDSWTASGTYGFRGIPTCLRLIMTQRVACLQFVWLLACLCCFISVGVNQFIRAKTNVEAEWKPEKIDYIIDYVSGDTTDQYEMPYIYIFVVVSSANLSNSWSFEMINETLADMLESQANFNTSVSVQYVSPDLQSATETLYSEYAGNFFYDYWTNETFFSYFKMRFSNPDPARGSFQFRMLLDTHALKLNETIDIVGVWVSVSRDTARNLGNLAYLPANDAFGENETVAYVVDYSEEVHFGWKVSEPSYYFETNLAYEDEVPEEYVLDSGGIWITFRAPSKVEYWVEYVDFSYHDWFFALGGTLSIITVCFFFVAHRVAEALGESYSIGILPGMSISFRNLEMLSWLKSQLDRKHD